MVPTPEGGPKRNSRPRPTARGPTVNGAGERATWPGSAGHRRDSKGCATPVASTAIGCVTAFETNLPRTLTSLPPPPPPPPPLLPPSPLPRLAAAATVPRQARMAMAAAMAHTAVVLTMTAVTVMPTMKRCQLDSRLAPVMTYHHGRREPLMAATIELCSRQATEETVSPLRLRTGGTRMKDISVVLFLPFLVARNRVMAPLLMSYSFQPAVAAVAPTVISRGPRRRTAIVTTATVPIGVRSSSTAAVVVVIVRNRSCDTTAAATVHQAGPSHRQPPLSRTRPMRSGSNRTRWRCRCSPCRRGRGSSHRTPLHQLGGRPRRQL